MPSPTAAYMRDYRAKDAMRKADGGLLPFQNRFVNALTRKRAAPEIGILCTPRAQGKSWLCGQLIGQSLTPGSDFFEAGVENVLVASSRAQSGITLEFARQAVADVPGIRWSNDGAVHVESRARIKIISSDARRSLGLGAHARWLFCDEPAAWSPQAGRRLFDSMRTALGKRKCQIVLCGTLAPSPTQGPGAWWPDLIEAGSGAGVHLELLQADEKRWREWDEVLSVNPAHIVNPFLEKTLRREFEEALQSERAAVPFRQYRLNLPGGESTGEQELISDSEWERIISRPVPDREGRPVVAVDLGSNRSWSACAALWPESNRIECWALAPGATSIGEQERQDQMPADAYRELVGAGGLAVDEGNAVPRLAMLLDRCWQWDPEVISCDNHRSGELRQEVAGRCKVVERGSGEVAGNVQAMRARLLDSEAGLTESSRALLGAAFKQVILKITPAGETRLEKRDRRRSRDDVAQALLLACGFAARRSISVSRTCRVLQADGSVTASV